MIHITKLKIFFCVFLLAIGLLVFGATTDVKAAPAKCYGNSTGELVSCESYRDLGTEIQDDRCYRVGESISEASCSDPEFQGGSGNGGSGSGGSESIATDCNEENVSSENCGIIKELLRFINVLSGLVGIVIVIMITISGIQYSAAGDNPQTAAAAKKHLMNAVVALILFIFGVAALQYLVPGGVL